MCPMCEKRAQLLLQQQQQQAAAAVKSSSASVKPPGRVPSSQAKNRSSLFRNPFKSCKNLTHQCCSPVCESQRTSVHSIRRSSVRPSLTPDHSGEIAYLQHDYRVSESPSSPDQSHGRQPKSVTPQASPSPNPNSAKRKRKPRSLLTRLKLLTGSQTPGAEKPWQEGEVSSVDSSLHVGREHTGVIISLLAAETSLDTISEASMDETETNVSESTLISMMNMNGSLSPPFDRGSTLKSSAYDDDASTFAIIPRTSTNSRDWTSDASGLSDRFGELDIGYLSLEDSGEGPDIDDTVSISSDLDPHDDTVSESDLDHDYTDDSWCTETEDTASVLQWSRGHISKNHLHLHLPDLETTPPHELTASSSHPTTHLTEEPRDETDEEAAAAPSVEVTEPASGKKLISSPSTANCTEYLCSRCGRKEKMLLHPDPEGQTTKKVTRKQNPLAAYFMDGEDQAVMAAKVVVLLGKYGNRRGLRVAGLTPPHNLDRLRSMISPRNDAVSAFQNEVARMMLEGVDVPGLNMDVEQFLAGYMKLHSSFYIDLIEDFFKSMCVDCFGPMQEVTMPGARSAMSQDSQQRPAYALLKPRRPGSMKR